MKTKQLVDGKWDYGPLLRKLSVGDIVTFTGNGRGRGGHYSVTLTITKVNRVTVEATEAKGSYRPGTLYIFNPLKLNDAYLELPVDKAVPAV